MRRLLSLVLVATLGMPLWAPLLALGQSTEAALPACCRRDGKHHCATGMMAMGAASAADSQTPRWMAPPEKCPYCPAVMSAAYQHTVANTTTPKALFAAAFFARPLGPVQTESKRRIAWDRSRQKRGPPAFPFATLRSA